MAANSECSEGSDSRSILSSVGRLPRRQKCYRIVIQWFLMDHIASSVHRFFTFLTGTSKILPLSLLSVHILDLVRLAASRLRFAADGASSPPKASIRRRFASKGLISELKGQYSKINEACSRAAVRQSSSRLLNVCRPPCLCAIAAVLEPLISQQHGGV